ncbi:UTRA domain-containing protein [Shinella kummerowiae]|jgi:GntR family transcriptional regulator|uniref:UTRA domain-containing protein n=1 Tax=Shinella kummerowiae TaxID=417745 RepID=A0A6N8SFR3_9HYPH|nr:GntR family transcriptional regulator [Shinella kummerowiae]MXN46448.1 UTRA domain-containing protein [Shinella kummerowiae]
MTETWLKKKPIRKSGAVPMYAQVAEILDTEVKSRNGAHFALPSEGELSREFGVSRVTIRQALKQLETRGVIYSEHGRGYFSTASRMRGVSGFHSFTREVQKLGGKPGSTIVSYDEKQPLPPAFRKHLQTEGESKPDFIVLRRVRTIDGDPVALEDAYLPMALYPSANRAMFEGASLYTEMTATWGIVPTWTDALFEPAAATAEEAGHLRIEPGAPILIVWRVTVTDTDQAIEYVKSVYKGDGFMLNVNRYRL